MAVADITGKPLAELLSLEGRGAVVTGGAQGLGKGIARRLAEAGASLLIGDLNLDLAEQAAAEFTKAYGGTVRAAHLDVTNTASIAALADRAVSEFGSLDVWVNNAGIYPNVLLLDMTDEIWDQVMKVNLRGTFSGSREAARRMIAAGKGGVIVNVVSTAGFKGVAPGVSAYVSSKHGVHRADQATGDRTGSARYPRARRRADLLQHRRQRCRARQAARPGAHGNRRDRQLAPRPGG